MARRVVLMALIAFLGLGCGDGSEPDGNGGAGLSAASCEMYLECTLLTCPECYAGALTLYGDGAACWDTPEQADACGQACDELLSELEVRVVGSECLACAEKLESSYVLAMSEEDASVQCESGAEMTVNSLRVSIAYDDKRGVTVTPTVDDRGESLFFFLTFSNSRGTQPCEGGPFEASVSGASEFVDGASMDATITLTPADDGQTVAMSFIQIITDESGATNTCRFTASMVRN